MVGACIATGLSELGIVAALVLFFVAVPAGTPPGLFRIITGTGVVASLGIGLLMRVIVTSGDAS